MLNKNLPLLLQYQKNPDIIKDVMYMKSTAGWRMLEEYIDNQINTCTHNLIHNRFLSLEEPVRLQTMIASFKLIKDTINKIN